MGARNESQKNIVYRRERGDEDGGFILVQGGRSWWRTKREGEGNGGWLEGKRESMHACIYRDPSGY